ncbi:hypothetical protein LXA11_17560, partial [Erwinia amylovora]|nr:hypothetical protein [Erwinia amylovora]
FVFHLYKGDKSNDVPLLRNESGEDVCFIRKMGSKLVFFLPEIYDKAGLLFDLFNNVLPDIGFSNEKFQNHGSFNWINDFDYISWEERNKIIDIKNE